MKKRSLSRCPSGLMRTILALSLSLLLCLAMIGPAFAAGSAKCRVLVGFKGAPDANLVRGFGGKITHTYRIAPAVAAEVPTACLSALAANPKISYVELDQRVHILQQTIPWGVDRIDAELVHPYNKGTGVKVAIIDTGIDYTHPDLDANYKGGYDFVNGDADPKDDNGHGTHCAGIVAAEDNTEGVVGVAPEASLYAVKVLDRLGSGWLSNVIAGIDWSVGNDMDVVSMSLGTSTYSASLKTACDNAYNAGLVLVAAAGNSGDGNPGTAEYSYPAAYGSVIAVGATNSTDVAPPWSNSGPYLELAAPGVSIYSTLPTYRVTLTRTYGYNYGTLSGTSMACPHVTGTAALVMASDPTLTNVDVRSRLQTTADDLGPVGWDSVYGYGLVDADEAAPNIVPDTTPPLVITDLTATASAYPNINLAWSAATDNVGVAGYKVYRSTVATINKATDYLASTTAISYTDSTGVAGTTYHYAVYAYDAAGNEAGLSNIASATVAEAPANAMHIASIDMSATRIRLAGWYTYATATVTVVDQNGNPVSGATVSGHWSGLTTDLDSGTTNALGRVSLNSNLVKNAVGTFTFTVDNVALSGWTYDPVSNVETSDSITVP